LNGVTGLSEKKGRVANLTREAVGQNGELVVGGRIVSIN